MPWYFKDQVYLYPYLELNLRFWFLPQQRTIWANMTNNTTKVTSKHKNIFIMLSNSRLDIGLETLASTSELLPLSNLAK